MRNKEAYSAVPAVMLSPIPNRDGILFYQQWFVEAWREAGGIVVERRSIPHAIRVMMGRFSPGVRLLNRGRMIVLSSGRVESSAWPSLLSHEIVPMLWDLWPQNVAPLVRFVKRHKIKVVFCTSSQTVKELRSLLLGVNVVWVPEGIKVDAYPYGAKLRDRPVDVLSYGRQMSDVIHKLQGYKWSKHINTLFRKGTEHLFADFTQLIKGLQSSKITICYPQSATHPDRAHEIETLTQRYWEAMLTGTLLAGHAPAELVEVCGYNPVIELGDDPCGKINEVLSGISAYQDIADRNRRCAEKVAGWDKRMSMIMEALK